MGYPVFASGDVLNASDMNAVGLWLVKTQTIGSAVSSVTVTGAFSSNYDNYLITVNGGVASQQVDLQIRLGSTTTGYHYGMAYLLYGSNVVNGIAANNTTSFPYGGTGTGNNLDAYIQINNPNVAKVTTITSAYRQTVASGGNGTMHGFLNDTTQYTAFTLLPNTGNITGGIIRVYGYRN